MTTCTFPISLLPPPLYVLILLFPRVCICAVTICACVVGSEEGRAQRSVRAGAMCPEALRVAVAKRRLGRPQPSSSGRSRCDHCFVSLVHRSRTAGSGN